MRFLLRIAPGLLVVAAATSLYSASASGTEAHPTVSHTVAACADGQIDSWLNTNGNGAAGTIYYDLQFTNLSAQTCSLDGFPGVSAVNIGGHQIGGAATRNGSRHKINVRPGATVEATLGVVETGNFSGGDCKPVTAFGLRVYAPNQRSSDIIPWPFSVCSKSSTISINIQSVAR
jgi:hypothetical protein